MESVRLVSFYKSVSEWPSTEAELAAVAQRVRELLEVPVVLIHVDGMETRSSNQDEAPMLQLVEKQIQTAGSLVSGQLRQTRLSDPGPWKEHLTMVRISEETRSLPGSSGSGSLSPDRKARRDFGWLIVNDDRPLSTKAEILLIAAASRLAQLAVAAELRSAVSLRDQFLSIASHELKTPLTSIYGVLQLQERMLRLKKAGAGHADLPEEYRAERDKQYSFLKMVIRQVERLNELIDGLLNVSRIQNGRFMVEPSDNDVASLLKEVVQSRLMVIAQEAGVQIHVESPDALTAWIDPIRFEEVVNNLVMNAIRYSPEGGMIWLKLKEEGEDLLFTVRDQGMTVPESDRERIFKPFERAKSSVRMGGLGLGLFISRQIAQMHGGDVALAEAMPGRGNRFEARFPMRAARVRQLSA